ncbi:hypothetical protein F7Q99_35800 [Streptomyces kaniharaensis]|uniref:Uncharacterized protein n=1 Tax=Streptomyces kaniharaensis TaxID=212423 RepID=A0A6N7L086_9ACTN|nr:MULTISPECIES: hypothetical protein [Streptomyces]MQS17406.1 hypothetical protein [Streptomyces kaniharaensis]
MKWNVEVDIPGIGPRMLTVDQPSASDALEHTKSRVNDMFLQLPSGITSYTVAVFEPGHRTGDASVCAESITLVTATEPARG